MLGNITEDQVGGDRRDLVKPGFAEFAFDVIFLSEPEPAVGLQSHVGGCPGRIRGQQLRHIGFRTAGLSLIEQTDRLLHH